MLGDKKRETTILAVEDEVEENDDNVKEIQVSAAVTNMEVEHEPTVVQLKGCANSNHPSMILIDSGSTHNMISANFATKLGLPLIPVAPCSVLLPNDDTSSIDHCILNASVSIQGVETKVDFEVWNGARYDVILGMA